jgi:hypothetical protein
MREFRAPHLHDIIEAGRGPRCHERTVERDMTPVEYAFIIADPAGHTALTEAQGGEEAANVVDRDFRRSLVAP